MIKMAPLRLCAAVLSALLLVALAQRAAAKRDEFHTFEDEEEDEAEAAEEREPPRPAAAAAAAKPAQPPAAGAGGSGSGGGAAAAAGAGAGAWATSAAGARGARRRGEDDEEEEEDLYVDEDEERRRAALDEDEFVGAPTPSVHEVPEAKHHGRAAASAAAAAAAAAAASAAAEEAARPRTLLDHWMEVSALSFLLLYALVFVRGRARNQALADAWFAAMRPLLEQQFAEPGLYADAPVGEMFKENQACFKFYASGRRFCRGALCTLDLVKRHDLFTLALAALGLASQSDVFTLEVDLLPDCMEPFVFAAVPVKHAQKVRKGLKDLENFTVLFRSKVLPPHLAAMSDCPELEHALFNEQVLRLLAEDGGELLTSLHFTDQNAQTFASKTVLRFVFTLPAPERLPRLVKLTEMALFLVDVVATTPLSAQARAAALKLRAEVSERNMRQTHEQRQELAQRRKEDQKKKEEAAFSNLSEEQKEKREDRERKQAAKKRMPKIKVMR